MNPNTRPTLAMAEAAILSTTYTRLPSGVAIVCEITMWNLHRCHGIANVVDMENYDEARGQKAAYDLALPKVFEVLSFDLHNKMIDQQIPNRHQELCVAYHNDNRKIGEINDDES